MCYNVLGGKMKVAKLRKVEEKKKIIKEEEEFTIKKFLITTGIILLVLTVFYFITTLVVKPLINTVSTNRKTIENSILMSQITKQKETDYYVLAIKESNYLNIYTDMNYKDLYNDSINKYKTKNGALKVYRVDMDDSLNSSYWDDEFNIETLKINDDTLFKISNGEIVEYYVGHTNILNAINK